MGVDTVISNEQGFTWAECDRCKFTMGVGFDCGKDEAMSALKQWGWRYDKGKITCRFCLEAENRRSA